MTDTAAIPVIHARRKGVHLIIRCRFCRRDHYHGVCSGDANCHAQRSDGQQACTCPVGSGDGHRIAHCYSPESPYHQTGYYLVERSVRRRWGWAPPPPKGTVNPKQSDERYVPDSRTGCDLCATGPADGVRKYIKDKGF